MKPSFSTLLTSSVLRREIPPTLAQLPRKGWETQCEDAGPEALGVPITTCETSGELFTSFESWLAYSKMGIPMEQGSEKIM